MSWEYEALFNRQDPRDQQLDFWSATPTAIKVGKMGYRTRTTWAGDRLEAEVFPIYGRGDNAIARAARHMVTREAQRKLNDRRAERKLILLAEANFTKDDYHMTLTYAVEPQTDARAIRDLKNFFGRVRRIRARKKLPDLKYIYAMGGGEGEEEKRLHFHLMINGDGLSREELEACWMMTPGAGRVNTDRLQPNEMGLEELSRYFFRQHRDRAKRQEGISSRRYSASRNLKQPKSRTSDSRCSNARVRKIAHDIRNEAKEEMEKIYPGYRFVDCRVYYSDVIDGVYIRVMMRKIQGGKRDGKV
ncbi:MAG: hypothetical protein J5916_02610 [Oscillospiraceae bacterium]|nr:hypothetical protein [Clostridia bacterium]MBO5638777.1 hypothetical protein [Oscillospiraceae bacterium]MBO6207173.1 hypothetical protein [Lachnospiraceae bacterium]